MDDLAAGSPLQQQDEHSGRGSHPLGAAPGMQYGRPADDARQCCLPANLAATHPTEQILMLAQTALSRRISPSDLATTQSSRHLHSLELPWTLDIDPHCYRTWLCRDPCGAQSPCR